MAKYILGLELGNSNIKLLECRKQGPELIIEKSKILVTPEGAVVDGTIIDLDLVYEVIHTEIKKGKYKAKNMLAVIKSSQIISRDITMDVMPKRDMDAILALQYQDYLLVDIEDYQVTYKAIQKVQDGDNKVQEVLIVAAPNTIINPLLDLASKLKMRVRTINIASDAVTHFFSKENPITANREEEVMVIDIGGKSTTVTIVSDGIGVLNRDIPFGLDAINPLLTREFGVEEVHKITAFKAEYAGIYQDDADVGEKGQYISSIIKPMIEYQLVSEIQRFLQFYFSRNKNNAIHKIYLVGGGSYLKNIDQYMTDLLGIPCVSGIELDETQVRYNTEFKQQSAYFANLLGLVSKFWG